MKRRVEELIKKYNRPVPRYTSYPTVPDWDTESFTKAEYLRSLELSYAQNGDEGISLYIHLPYCESLCTYCGCNTRITVNHAVEEPYVSAVLKEFFLVKKHFHNKPLIREIHLGGGTPTFFSPKELQRLILGILDYCDLHADFEFSFEGHPNNTSYEHLKTLYNLGFQRVSFGIQDVNLKVQEAINRIQTVDSVRKVTNWAREIGYTSVNFDLIYGLPFQTVESIRQTMKVVEELQPDRIAYYSYAHVPWKRPGQRAYSEKDLPSPELKRDLNRVGQEILTQLGYLFIGMDHFALLDDELVSAMNEGGLHRNFMGYTKNPGKLLIGLGVSSISDIHSAYGQNVKTLEGYLSQIEEGRIPIMKGHLMSTQDLRTKSTILELACEKKFNHQLITDSSDQVNEAVDQMLEEGLLEKIGDTYVVTDLGAQFLRNICALFDPYQYQTRRETTFSAAV